MTVFGLLLPIWQRFLRKIVALTEGEGLWRCIHSNILTHLSNNSKEDRPCVILGGITRLTVIAPLS